MYKVFKLYLVVMSARALYISIIETNIKGMTELKDTISKGMTELKDTISREKILDTEVSDIV